MKYKFANATFIYSCPNRDEIEPDGQRNKEITQS